MFNMLHGDLFFLFLKTLILNTVELLAEDCLSSVNRRGAFLFLFPRRFHLNILFCFFIDALMMKLAAQLSNSSTFNFLYKFNTERKTSGFYFGDEPPSINVHYSRSAWTLDLCLPSQPLLSIHFTTHLWTQGGRKAAVLCFIFSVA